MLQKQNKTKQTEFRALQEHGCPAAISENGCVTCATGVRLLCITGIATVSALHYDPQMFFCFFFAIIAVLQKVSHQSGLTVEQCTEEANWFRKIGNKNRVISTRNGMLTMLSFEILLHLHCLCVSLFQLGTQRCSVRPAPTE